MAADPEPLVNALHSSVVDRIEPQFAEIYNKYQAPYLRADQVTYGEFNANRAKYSFPIAQGPLPDVFTPTETSIVDGCLRQNGKLPVHINFHGGGFVIGGLKSDESWCRQACQSLGCVIVNVDYRLSPEFPHPVPVTDSWKALKWVFESATALEIDISRVSVGGTSAGANIATVLALMAKEDPSLPKLVMQLLVVPLVDVRFIPVEGSCDPNTTPYESLIKNEFAPCLPLNRLQWFYNLWLGKDDDKRKKWAEHFWASPILSHSHENVAPASFHVAGVETLTSEGIAYHEVLIKARVESKLTVYEGCGHLFGGWDSELDQGKTFVRNSCDELRKAYRSQ